jgi:phosphatidylglycerophosphate synthase
MLGCIAVALVRHEPMWCTAGGLVALAVRLAAARGAWTPSGRLGIANVLTLIRLVGVALLPLAFAALPRVGFVALVLGLLALDSVDGRVARARGDASAFGAALDMETDALSVLLLSMILWREQLAGPWVLVAGLWRYVYAALVAMVPSLGEAPRSNFGRVIYAVLVISFAGAFLPVAGLAPVLAAVGTTLVSISFARSLVQSRAFAQAPASAATSSLAASDQERRDRRAA